MKKALQIPHLRAPGSVSERAVVREVREGLFDRPRNDFAQVLVLDSGSESSGLFHLFPGGWRRALWGRLCGFHLRLRKRPGDELQRGHPFQTLLNLACTLRQFERPDRISRVDDQRAVAREARGPRTAGDLGAHCGRPGGDGLADRALRAEAAELALDLVTERFQRAPPPAGRRRPAASPGRWP